MTMLCEEALATPSQRLLRIGQEHPGVADAYAEAHAVLLAYRDADPYVYASLSAHALAILGVGAQLSASIQFVGADDPRHVLFDRIMIASASALAGAALMATTGATVAVVGHPGIDAQMVQQGISVWYGSPVESEHEVAALTTSALAVRGESVVERLLPAVPDDELLNWETQIALARQPAGRVLFHMREGSRRAFRLVSDD